MVAAGRVFSWGWNEFAQLGTGDANNRLLPTLVHGIDRIKSVCAGYKHTVLLTNYGSIGVLGDNTFGQLGNAISDSLDQNISIYVGETKVPGTKHSTLDLMLQHQLLHQLECLSLQTRESFKR